MKFDQPENPKMLRCSIAYNELGAYCVPDSGVEEGIIDIVKRGVVYEGCTMHFVRENCGDGDIIHAGTYFGDMLPGFSQKCKGRVWAFEPVNISYRCAEITCKLNGGLGNVFLINSGLGSKQGLSIIRTANKDSHLGGGAKIQSEINPDCIEETINLETIDQIIPKQREVSIMQLDVEGYEIEALKGGIETIERCKPILILEALEGEYKPELITDNEWIIENIFSMGYTMADFDGVMGDKGFKGRVHANVILVHPDRPYSNYHGQKP